MGMVGSIAIAAMMIFMLYRLWPTAKMWLSADAPKGSSNDWIVAALLLGGVMLFVWILIQSV